MKTKSKLADEIKEAQEWAMENLLGKKVFCPMLNAKVEIRRSGIKHTLQYKTSKIKIKTLYRVEKYIQNACKMIVEPDKKHPKNFVYKLSLIGKIDKKKYHIYVVIKEDKPKKYYYDSGIIKREA